MPGLSTLHSDEPTPSVQVAASSVDDTMAPALATCLAPSVAAPAAIGEGQKREGKYLEAQWACRELSGSCASGAGAAASLPNGTAGHR